MSGNVSENDDVYEKRDETAEPSRAIVDATLALRGVARVPRVRFPFGRAR